MNTVTDTTPTRCSIAWCEEHDAWEGGPQEDPFRIHTIRGNSFDVQRRDGAIKVGAFAQQTETRTTAGTELGKLTICINTDDDAQFSPAQARELAQILLNLADKVEFALAEDSTGGER